MIQRYLRGYNFAPGILLRSVSSPALPVYYPELDEQDAVFTTEAFDYFGRIADFCSAHGIRLILMRTPGQSIGRAAYEMIQTLADERGNAEVGHAGIDENDTVYLLRSKKDAPGVFEVFRREAPDHQLTGGVDRGLLPNVVEPAVEVSSEPTGDGRTFTCVFPGRQHEPAKLRAGRCIGFAQDALGFDDTYVTVEFAK